ncbi:MAG: exosortase system-associated protein, TIGR04073 family [Candidatus Omnitrophota bacterium]|nr:MAG: exosortase system-associated protein, TIGR04073 family [Candidatus Omnitrophota bacterium]
MKSIAILLVLILGISITAHAQEGAGAKLGRGLSNIATSWIELPAQIYVTAETHDPLVAAIYGPIKGAVFIALRLLSGLYDTVTFPADSEPLMEPEFVFGNW